jgi:hypothetical protein
MVPPVVGWSGQPVALVDEIECSFNDIERQPGSHSASREAKIAEIRRFLPELREKSQFGIQKRLKPSPIRYVYQMLNDPS